MKTKKVKVLRLSKFSKIFILSILICIFIYSAINITIWFLDNKNTEEVIENIQNIVPIVEEKVETNEGEVSIYQMDFEELKKVNKNTVAWLVVNGTNINYPVVKYKNNDYYLNHSFNNKYSKAGWLFMDYKNDIDTLDRNTVIYAHNRIDGSMFGTLTNTFKRSWFNEKANHYISLTIENKNYVFKVFSVYEIEVEDYYITTSFSDDKSYESFLTTLKNRSKFNFGMNLNKDDKIITLSTCTNQNDTRAVVHAKLIFE